jgi:hypothetical protein
MFFFGRFHFNCSPRLLRNVRLEANSLYRANVIIIDFAHIDNRELCFPGQVFNSTEGVVAGYQGAPWLEEFPRLYFELLGGAVHGQEGCAVLGRREVFIGV